MAQNKKATLVSPDGVREDVEIGSDREREFFANDYVLEKTPPVGSLKGTLTPETPLEATNASPESSFARFENVLQQVSQRALEQVNRDKPASLETLERLSGGKPIDPSLINQALSNEFSSRQARIKEAYGGVLGLESARIADQARKRDQLVELAFKEEVLNSGIMPSGLDPDIQSIWKSANKGLKQETGELDWDVDDYLNIVKTVENPAEFIQRVQNNNWTGDITIPKDFSGSTNQRAYRNNNPGNLRKSPFAISEDDGFAVFSTSQDGYNALLWDLEQKLSGKGFNSGLTNPSQDTLTDLIFAYAPNSENDSSSYLNMVAQMTGYKPDTSLKNVDSKILASAIMSVESGSSAKPYQPKLIKDTISIAENDQLSGKYSQDFLFTRSQDFIQEDGTVDWISVDELQNVDENLWRDMQLYLFEAEQNAKKALLESETIESSKVRKEISKAIQYSNEPPNLLNILKNSESFVDIALEGVDEALYLKLIDRGMSMEDIVKKYGKESIKKEFKEGGFDQADLDKFDLSKFENDMASILNVKDLSKIKSTELSWLFD